MIDWNVIYIIAAISFGLGINMVAVKKLFPDEDTLSCFVNLCLNLLIGALLLTAEVAVLGILAIIASSLYLWGIGNSIIATAVAVAGIGLPLFGRKLVIRIPVALYHFTRRLIADFRYDYSRYKIKLDEEYPIKQIEPYHWR